MASRGKSVSKFPTASQVLNHARPKTVPPFKDEQIIAACEQCVEGRRLSECKMEMTETALNYRCSGCGEILVITRKPNVDNIPIPDSGYRLGEWVFANAVDVSIEGFDNLLFPAKRNATTRDIRLEKARKVDKSSG
jgi:hypothetical protein